MAAMTRHGIGNRVVVTGGNGFLGKQVVKQLIDAGYDVQVPKHSKYDLRRRIAVQLMYLTMQPDIVVHLAAECGGIGANQASPGSFLYDNLIMGLEMIDCAKDFGVRKFVQVGTVCAYPKYAPVPFREEDLWGGYPEETNAPYGLAKKMLLVQGQAYRQQYGTNVIYLLPANLYGPGDNFDPATSHVIPALIKKCLDAKRNGDKSITVWGTGSASREFLYVDDCAEAIVKATASYNGAEPINIGNGTEVGMRDLVYWVQKLTGYAGDIQWDPTKPDGQPRRSLEVSKAF